MPRRARMVLIAFAGLAVATACERADSASRATPGASERVSAAMEAPSNSSATTGPTNPGTGPTTSSSTTTTPDAAAPAPSTAPTTTVTSTTTTTAPVATTPETTITGTTTPVTTIPVPPTSTAATTPPASTTTAPPAPDRSGSIYDVRPPSDLPAPPFPAGWTSDVLGRSVNGRDITVLARPVDGATKGVLVVGGIHGNEPASPPTVRALVQAQFADDVAVWLVPELNPDGVAAGTRWNANEVDLNRNFPWDWRSSTGGPAPLSEPESQAITDFIRTVRPGLVVWVHQPLAYVSSVGGTAREFEAAWSAGSGLRTRSGVTQHGGGESWTYFEADLPSMLVEIDGWDATPEIVDAQLAGFQQLLVELGWSGGP